MRTVPTVLLVLIFAGFQYPAIQAQDKNTRLTNKNRKIQEASKNLDIKLRFKEAEVAPRTSDPEFLRRVTFDLVGRIPTLGETKSFLQEQSDTKRGDAIERLLLSPEFSDFQSRRWCEILFGNYHEIRAYADGKDLDRKKAQMIFGQFRTWLADQIAAETPWQQIVAELVMSQGLLSENSAILYKASFLRGGQDSSLSLADNMSRSLLGIRISCARCHDHPFDQWTQEDYYGLAAFFDRVRGKAIGGRKNSCDDVELYELKKGNLNMKKSEKIVIPKFLFGGRAGTTDPRLLLLAKFMTNKSNKQLPLNVVNRTWKWLMGRGFVEPVDDFTRMNRPIHGPAMSFLSKEFIRGRGSIKHLFRVICNAQAYQVSSSGVSDKPFATAGMWQPSGRQLFRSLVTGLSATEFPIDFNDRRYRELWNQFQNSLPSVFPAGYEWTEVTPLPGNTRQVLLLRNSEFVGNLMSHDTGLVGKVRDRQGAPPQKIQMIFLSLYNRYPEGDELKRYAAYVEERKGQLDAYQDIVWILINSAEFVTRH